jgi:Bacterial Ig domain
LSASAADEDGVHGFALYLDGEFLEYVDGRGHTSAVLAPRVVDIGGLAPGEHVLAVDTYDNDPEAPGASYFELPFTVQREAAPCSGDAASPDLTFFHPTSGTPLSPGLVTIGVDATDTSGVEWVQFYLDDEYRGTDSNVPYQHPWQASPGNHSLKAVALDGCGNYGEATVHVTVSDPCVGQPQPTVTITNLDDGAWLEPDRYAVAAQATAPAGQSIESVTFRVGDFPPFVDATAPWTTGQYQLSNEGGVAIEAEARDSCGRIARQSIQVNISANASVCDGDDGPPTATFTAPHAGAVLPAGTVAVLGNVHDDSVLMVGALEIDGELQPGQGVYSGNPADYRWNWQATPGTHTLRIRVSDVCWNMTISEPLTVTVVSGSPLADPNFWLLPAELRVLDGPVAPAGQPIDSLEEIEFGNIAGGRVGAARSFSLLNDGGRALTVSNITLTGTAFALDPAPAVPFVVPGFRGEVTFRIKPTGLGAGPVTETLTIESDLGPFVVKLKALVDPNARVVFRSRFDADFEEGNLSEWMSVTGTAVSASPLAKRTGNFGLQIDHAAGTSAQFVTYTSAFDGLNSWRMKFALRPDELQLPAGGSMVVAAGVKVGGSVGWVVLRREGTSYSVRAIALLDGGGWAATPWAPLTSKYSTVDVLWWRASDASAADGGIRLVTSDWTVVERTDLQNFQHRTERFRLGAGFGAPAGTTGVLHYDDVTIWY